MRDGEPRARLDARIKARQAAGEEDLTPDNGLGDFRTPEYSPRLDFGPDRAWEACRGMDMSFAFNAQARPEDYLTPEALITSFVEIVAHGGNLLLNVGPRADGSVPEPQVALLTALGDWLRTNGEAIYGTRATSAPKGVAADGTPYRTTAGPNAVNLLFLEAPRSLEVTLPGLVGAQSIRRLDGGGVALAAGSPVRLVLETPFIGPAPHGVVAEGAGIASAS
jgi:alpha-L-fucosidase